MAVPLHLQVIDELAAHVSEPTEQSPLPDDPPPLDAHPLSIQVTGILNLVPSPLDRLDSIDRSTSDHSLESWMVHHEAGKSELFSRRFRQSLIEHRRRPDRDDLYSVQRE